MLRLYAQMLASVVIGMLTSLLAIMMLGASTAQATGAATPILQLPGWNVSQAININNTSNPVTLTNYQVRVDLTAANFDFAHARADGGDLRFTDSDRTTLLSYWIQSYISATRTASIWVRVPEIPASSIKTIYLWYNNYAATTTSNGDATFEFFDDFEKPSPGYYEFGSATTVMSQTLPGETSAPHTLDAVQVNLDHTYYGYYGLQDCGGGIGLARSDDLETWIKDPTPIVSTTEDARWASVILSGTIFHMVYNNNYCYSTQIVYRTSTDGVDFGAGGPTVLVPYTGTLRHVNPDLFLNPNDDQFYLYYTDIDENDNSETIKVRHAATVPGLASAPEQALLSSANILAAPDMMYYDGTYFLSSEVFEGGVWQILIYAGQSATGPFVILPGNPVLADNSACLSQHLFGTTLHGYYCKLTGTTWTIEHRTADLTLGRLQSPDPSKWSPVGGSWRVISATEPNGSTGNVLRGTTTGVQALTSIYTGTDYIFEGRGAQLASRVWGLGTRFDAQNGLFASKLYEDLDGADNLYLYDQTGGSSVRLNSAALGTIDLNTWYSMTVAVAGANIQVYRNNTLALTATSTAHPTGGVALLGENGTTALFGDVWVRQYASPEPTASFESPTAINLTRLSAKTQSSLPKAPYGVIGVIGLGLVSYTLASFVRKRRQHPGRAHSSGRSTFKDVHAPD